MLTAGEWARVEELVFLLSCANLEVDGTKRQLGDVQQQMQRLQFDTTAAQAASARLETDMRESDGERRDALSRQSELELANDEMRSALELSRHRQLATDAKLEAAETEAEASAERCRAATLALQQSKLEREEQERELRRMEQAAAIQQQNLTQRLGEMEEAKIVMQQQQLMIKTLSAAAGRAP